MSKVPNQVYAAEVKAAAVQQVKGGQSVSAVALKLGVSARTLRNWINTPRRN